MSDESTYYSRMEVAAHKQQAERGKEWSKSFDSKFANFVTTLVYIVVENTNGPFPEKILHGVWYDKADATGWIDWTQQHSRWSRYEILERSFRQPSPALTLKPATLPPTLPLTPLPELPPPPPTPELQHLSAALASAALA